MCRVLPFSTYEQASSDVECLQKTIPFIFEFYVTYIQIQKEQQKTSVQRTLRYKVRCISEIL